MLCNKSSLIFISLFVYHSCECDMFPLVFSYFFLMWQQVLIKRSILMTPLHLWNFDQFPSIKIKREPARKWTLLRPKREVERVHFLWDLIGNSDSETRKIEERARWNHKDWGACAVTRAGGVTHSVRLRSGYVRQSLSLPGLGECLFR